MGLTVTVKHTGVAGNLRVVAADITGDSSHASGGESLTAGDFGFKGGTIQALHAGSSGGYVFSYDYANSKLLAYQQKDPGNAGGADIPLVEAATANLSAVTTRAIAFISGA